MRVPSCYSPIHVSPCYSYMRVSSCYLPIHVSPCYSHLRVIPCYSHMRVSPCYSHMRLSPCYSHMRVSSCYSHMRVSPCYSHMRVSPCYSPMPSSVYSFQPIRGISAQKKPRMTQTKTARLADLCGRQDRWTLQDINNELDKHAQTLTNMVSLFLNVASLSLSVSFTVLLNFSSHLYIMPFHLLTSIFLILYFKVCRLLHPVTVIIKQNFHDKKSAFSFVTYPLGL